MVENRKTGWCKLCKTVPPVQTVLWDCPYGSPTKAQINTIIKWCDKYKVVYPKWF